MPTGCCQSRAAYIEEQGAFNLFMTSDDQTPADIAGDKNNI